MQEWFLIHKLTSIAQYINRTKDQNHTVILIDAEQVFDHIQYLFMIKKPSTN